MISDENNARYVEIRKKLRLFRRNNPMSFAYLARQIDVAYMTLHNFLILEKEVQPYIAEKIVLFLSKKGFWDDES